ncbi:unnamed protein product, partial [Aphanomyces euteiches]
KNTVTALDAFIPAFSPSCHNMHLQLVVLSATIAISAAFGSLPVPDGKTTRCWAIADDPTIRQPNSANSRSEGEGLQCPFQVTFSLPNTSYVGQMITANWTISYTSDSLDNNAIGYDADKPLALKDPRNGQYEQVFHSNIHSCTYGEADICDPFVDAKIARDATPNQVANFTSQKQAAFVYTELSFITAGYIWVLAHIALPGPNASFRYDFATYRKLQVLPALTTTAVPTPAPDSSSHTLALAVGIGGGVLVIILIAVIIVVMRKKKQSQQPGMFAQSSPPPGYPYDHTGTGGFKTHSSGGRPTMKSTTNPNWEYNSATQSSQMSNGVLSREEEDTLNQWRLDENDIVPEQALSRGAFGEVWRGKYRGSTVAIKKLLASQSGPAAIKTFVAEIVLMSKLDSKYIVKFIGVSWYRKAEMMLILEYMDDGDLRSKLESTTQETLPLETKLDYATSIAEGLVYLHTLDTGIIHRDIKSRNVLLDTRNGTKLTDFGVSREETSETMTIGIGTYRWMAPEILGESHYSQAADIYSFGVILAELDLHILPYSDQMTEKGNPLNDTAIMGRVMQGSIKPTFSDLYPPALLQLAHECLSFESDKRPTALEVAYRLRLIRKDWTGKRDY